jgi:nicotinate-nucleotide pyrophosphorylase (carboxylating)
MSDYHPPLRATPPMARPAIRRPAPVGGVSPSSIVPEGFPLTPDELAATVMAALIEDQAFNDISTIATVASTRPVRRA